MSYGRDGLNGGYVNGYRNQQPPTRYDEDYQNGQTAGGGGGGGGGARRARRPGGYGGYMNQETDNTALQNGNGSFSGQDPYNASPVPTWRRDARNREESGERPRFAGSSRGYGDGPGARQIEGVVQHIHEKWDFLSKDECVPVHVALQLMDYSSLGRGNDYEDFKRTSGALHRALRTIVNENHQGFNSSIGTFHKIQASIQLSQDRVRTLKSSLSEAKLNLTIAKPELKGLSMTSQNFDEMLQMLGQIEKVQALPEQLDARISDKHFLTAVDILQDALRLIRNSSLEDIGALADLRSYLSNQETSLTDILLEELHDHLYLKSPYCQSRWKAYYLTSGDLLDSDIDMSSMTTGIRPLYRFLTGLNIQIPMVDDASRNPEEDNFEYIHMLIEALNKMGRLDLAVERMEQRLPIELFAVVEKTNQEVDHRHPAHLRTNQATDRTSYLSYLGKTEANDLVLNDLLYTLFSKFEAIAEGHRAVHEVIAGIIEREGMRKTSTLIGGFKELWKLLQSEMRSLLHDYLATDGNNALYTQRDSINLSMNIFQKNPRDKLKRVFKLGEFDKKSVQLSEEQQELDKILEASVPGLVNKSQRRSSISNTADRRITYETRAAGHQLLVEPNVFNISVLLPPSLSFLQRLKDIVPPDSEIAVSTLTSFLDDFLVNVFNPQLDDTITELCNQVFIDSSSFQQDSQWTERSRIPIFKGASRLLQLVRAFCKMLDNIPQDQALSQLIVAQLEAYHKACTSWYTSMVMRPDVEPDADDNKRLKLAAAKMKGSDLAVVVKSIWEGDDSDRERLMQEEVGMIIKQAKEQPLDPLDIISDRRTGTALCMLYSSMQWLTSQLDELRVVVKSDESSQPAEKSGKENRWTMVSAANMRDDDQPVKLSMTEETVGPFDNILALCRELATTALLTLHVDIRLGINFMMSQVVEGPFVLNEPVNVPDRSILTLNSDLLAFDDTMTSHLPEKEYQFVTSGLGLLLDSFLIMNATNIKVMNQNGCGRMQLNILVLQQNLKGIESDIMLKKSAQFFEYFQEGSKAVVEKAKKNKGSDMDLNEEEIKILIELCYSEALNSPQREVAAQAKRAMQEDLLSITESMWSS